MTKLTKRGLEAFLADSKGVEAVGWDDEGRALGRAPSPQGRLPGSFSTETSMACPGA
jgi:hypothetical protein